MMLMLVLIAWAVAFMADFKTVYKQGKPAVRVVCAVLLLLGAVVQVLYELHVKVPSPAPPITEFVSNVLNLK